MTTIELLSELESDQQEIEEWAEELAANLKSGQFTVVRDLSGEEYWLAEVNEE